MKNERLLDAFGQINEKFIEEANPEKKRANNQKKKSNAWMKWGAMTACAIVIVGVAVPMLRTDRGTEGADGNGSVLEGNIADQKPGVEEGPETEIEEGKPYEQENWDVTIGPMVEVRIRIDEMKTDGFVGTIVTGAESFLEGETFTVVYQDNVTVVQQDGAIFGYFADEPNAEGAGYVVGDMVWVGFQKYELEEDGTANRLYAYHVDGNRGASASATEGTTKDEAGEGYATDNEPMLEIPLEKAQDIELFPTDILDGYELEESVEVYDQKVVVARFYNAELKDSLMIRVYDKEYFYSQNDDVEFNSILYQGDTNSFIYFEGDEKIIRYRFSNRDIADIEDFWDMVYSANYYKQGGDVPEIKEG